MSSVGGDTYLGTLTPWVKARADAPRFPPPERPRDSAIRLRPFGPDQRAGDSLARENPRRRRRDKAPSGSHRFAAHLLRCAGGGRLVLKSTISTSSSLTASRSMRPLTRAPAPSSGKSATMATSARLPGAKAAAKAGSSITASVSRRQPLGRLRLRSRARVRNLQRQFQRAAPARHRATAPAAHAPDMPALETRARWRARARASPARPCPPPSDGRISRGVGRSTGAGVSAQDGGAKSSARSRRRGAAVVSHAIAIRHGSVAVARTSTPSASPRAPPACTRNRP